jgi:hypothetical protein
MKKIGSTITEVLLIVFIVLKLTGLINWSWLWVLAPFWIPFGLVLFGFIILLIAKYKK